MQLDTHDQSWATDHPVRLLEGFNALARLIADLKASPAPGGGSVAALAGALSTALSAMVGNLTTGKKGYEAQGAAQDANAVSAQSLREGFLADIDADTAAFDAVMAAFGLPKKTPEDASARDAAVQAATLGATLVPLRVLERAVLALGCAEVALQGNSNARSDAGVAVLMARAAAEGAWYNVSINLRGLVDGEACAALQHRADVAMQQILEKGEALSAGLRQEMMG